MIARHLRPGAGKRLLFVCGPPGIGKTELLRQATAATERPVVWVDCLTAASMPAPRRLHDAVLVLDNFDEARPFISELRDWILPLVGDDCTVLAGGHRRPGRAWRAAWRGRLHELELGPLSEAEAREYLARRGQRAAAKSAVGRLARGHPLTLALLAEALTRRAPPTVRVDPPDLMRALLAEVLVRAPPRTVTAIRACAVAMYLTARSLRVMTGEPRAVFDDLAALSFVRHTRGGVVLHDVVRELVLDELRSHHPELLEALARRAAGDVVARVQRLRVEEHRQIAHLLALAPRYPGEPLLRDDLRAAPASRAELAVIRRLIERREGPESAARFAFWARHGASVFSWRGRKGALEGFHSTLVLHRLAPGDVAADPGVVNVWRRARALGSVVLMRHWGSLDGYQRIGQVQTQIFNAFAETATLHEARLLSVTLCAPDDWEAFYVPGVTPVRARELDFVEDGTTRAIQVFDLSVRPLVDRARVMLAAQFGLATFPCRLGRRAFAQAVVAALKRCSRPDLLARHPLVLEDPRQLVALLRRECDALLGGPRDEVVHRVMVQTWFEPAGKQLAIAAQLGLPFGTYRRHLSQGTARLIEALWARTGR